MENIKLFKTEQNYFTEREYLAVPNLSYIEDMKSLYLKNRADYIYFYNDFDNLISDINNDNIGENSIQKNDNSSCEITLFNNNLTIKLLKNITVKSCLQTNYNYIINLNKNTIYCDNAIIICNSNITIINGNIISNPQSYDIEEYGIILESGSCNINNVKFTSNSHGGGTKDNPTSIIKCKNDSILTVTNSTFTSNDDNGGCVSNINIDENCQLIGENTTFTLTSPNGISANIHSNGNIHLTNCIANAYANHTANAQKNDYATCSRAIQSINGDVTLINCEIYGTHSGLTIKNGSLKINGGVYNGYSHGGVYFYNPNQNNYLYNASFNDVSLKGEGMYDDGIAGTNHAGMYSSANYLNVYMDNCTVYGLQQPIVLKFNATSSHDIHFYFSNTNINLDYQNYGIRNDGANYVTFGLNNNFNENNLRYKQNYDHTNEIYYFE